MSHGTGFSLQLGVWRLVILSVLGGLLVGAFTVQSHIAAPPVKVDKRLTRL